MKRVLLVIVVAGCGFRASAPDGGAADLAAPGDAAIVMGDGAPAMGDLAVPAGPGLLGALPSGYCCTVDTECRNRFCDFNSQSNKPFCRDSCLKDDQCMHYTPGWTCNTMADVCESPQVFTNCIDAQSFRAGPRPIGACCSDVNGSECLGGNCILTGSANGKSYCTQGCDVDKDCPPNYGCFTIQAGRAYDDHTCWKLSSINDPSTVETCSP
jgi:hypothetical protein